MKKLLTVVGARPQFIKSAPVSRALLGRVEEIQVHTGQHYDEELSGIFYEELKLPRPAHSLEVGSHPHGVQTGRMLEAVERVCQQEAPDMMLVYGDTNSTLAGALAAAKLGLPVAHVEAGLRSFNRQMPEEINRVLTDHLAGLLFCPTDTSVANLKREGITRGVHQVGDVMFDAFRLFEKLAAGLAVLPRLQLEPGGYILATVHRAENTDDPRKLAGILAGLTRVAGKMPVILPAHPRTRSALVTHGLSPGQVRVIPPVSYLEMVRLESAARVICTDSGGVQKEACFCGVPCVTLREETEWVETVEAGINVLAGSEESRIHEAVMRQIDADTDVACDFYGDGKASEKIAAILDGAGP